MRMIFRDFTDSSVNESSVIWARRTQVLSPAHRRLRRIPLVRLTHTPPYHAGGNEYEENFYPRF